MAEDVLSGEYDDLDGFDNKCKISAPLEKLLS